MLSLAESLSNMSFLAPFTLLGLLLVSLPVAIHLLVRRRGRRLDFPSLRFLRETPSFKLYPRHIRQPLLLALRAAAIILFVIGMARPLLTFRQSTPDAVRFILLDASFSMKTRGRAEAAREQARALVDKLKDGERASVMALSSEAVLLTELTGNKEELLEAIKRYEPAGGAVDYEAGIAEIRRQLEREPQVMVEADIISDFQESGLEAQSLTAAREASFLRLVTYPVGSAIERNAFLNDEMVRKTERGIELSVSEIISEPEGRAGTRQTWTIDRSEGATSGIEWRTETNHQFTGRVKVLDADDFDADDERYFAFAPPSENRLLLIEDGSEASLYLRAALEAAATGERIKQSVLDSRPRLPSSAADLAPYALVVVTLHGAAQESEANVLTEYARAGGTVWMFLARDLDTESWNRLAKAGALPFESLARKSGNPALRFGAVDTKAPQLSGLDESALAELGAVRLSESYDVTPQASTDTLIRWSDSVPAFISARVGKGTMLLLATSPTRESGELGLSPSFPALASSIIGAAPRAREPLAETIGEAVRLNVAPDVEVKIRDANGSVVVTRARELIVRPLVYFKEPGIYQLEFAGQQQFMAFNSPAPESERALATPARLKGHFSASEVEKTVAVSAGDSRDALERGGSTWRYFLCAAFLLMIAELFVATRQRQIAEG